MKGWWGIVSYAETEFGRKKRKKGGLFEPLGLYVYGAPRDDAWVKGGVHTYRSEGRREDRERAREGGK